VSTNTLRETATILLVEDNPDHAELVARSFRQSQTPNTIRHVTDGRMALNYLFRREQYADAAISPRPDVILLDLRLPKIDGLEVLREIKDSHDLRCIPVVVLTTSQTERDIARAYQLHANSYLVKPVEFAKFTRMIEDLNTYWLQWNWQPSGTDDSGNSG